MSAYFQSSGPRGNAYSESKCSNWTEFDPWHLEASHAMKMHAKWLEEEDPLFPYIFVTPASCSGFVHACTRGDVEHRLQRMPPGFLNGLRAVFILAGTRKQLTSQRSSKGCYGMYYRGCIFLCAQIWGEWEPSRRKKFFLDEVLIHEVAHHVDRFREADNRKKEGFAENFVERKCA